MNYKICIDDRNYENWNTFIDGSHEPINLPILNPLKNKLFTGDVFSLNSDGTTSLIHSTLKFSKNIPGVLMLSGKTFGRKKNKLFYKLIPDDKRLPIFLVAYPQEKNSFSKHIYNKYVVFKFNHWNDKHPEAIITNSLGNVNELNNFYEYQLYCKSLNASIQNFSRNTAKALRVKTEDEYIDCIMNKFPSIENRLNEYIISIDPKVSGDFDDAFSLKILSDTHYIISIYISNVSIWMDSLELWESFSQRIATIYLPDRKRPMLPTCLADCLCSLIEKSRRFAFTCDITVKDNQIINTKYLNTLIKLHKNYVYEEEDMKKDEMYKKMFTLIKNLSKKYKLYSNINDSHDIIHYLMVLMNYYSAKQMMKCKNGIYRSAILNKNANLPNHLSQELVQFINMWNSSGGQYVVYNDELNHEILNLESYIHITSPIRRLPDLLNLIQIQKNLNLLSLSESSNLFYQNWLNRLDYINTTMRAIRKVQVDCNLLNYVYNNEDVLKKKFKGSVFDMIERNDGLFQYICYIEEIKLVSRITLREKLIPYQDVDVKLYLFIDEEGIKKKIRIQKL
tara:strand:- start:2958 stop:4649 length:1692 start_codon:yes stop_codon:yes gene_type:complete